MSKALREALQALLDGGYRWVSVDESGALEAGETLSNGALLSGSFNPLHDGHRQMHAAAADKLSRQPLYELPLLNADKKPIAIDSAVRRVAQFAGHARIVLTGAPRFIDKTNVFPASAFVLGADTAARLFQTRFYGGDEPAMWAALHAIDDAGCRFLVVGRHDSHSGRFLTLADFDVPSRFAHLFSGVSEQEFRVDLSSTELRERGEGLDG